MAGDTAQVSPTILARRRVASTSGQTLACTWGETGVQFCARRTRLYSSKCSGLTLITWQIRFPSSVRGRVGAGRVVAIACVVCPLCLLSTGRGGMSNETRSMEGRREASGPVERHSGLDRYLYLAIHHVLPVHHISTRQVGIVVDHHSHRQVRPSGTSSRSFNSSPRS
jgi:hypothetical protein